MVKTLSLLLAAGLLADTCASTTGGQHRLRQKRQLQGSQGKIVGGSPVISKDEYPFFCVTDPISCGCSIIAPDIILTAAHCVNAFTVGTTVHIGGLRANGSDAEDTVTVAERFIHPSYVDVSRGDDVMVVRLTQASTVTSFAKLNRQANVPSGSDSLVAIGHGVTSSGGVSNALLAVTVPHVDHDTCDSRSYYNGDIIEDEMLCAGAEGIDSCQGDSGGPLIFGDSIVGITSWGIGCAERNHPGVYARVSEYAGWIEAVMCAESRAELLPECSGVTPDVVFENPSDDQESAEGSSDSRCFGFAFCPFWLEWIFNLIGSFFGF